MDPVASERRRSDGLASNLGTRHGRHWRAAGREPDSAAARRRARLAHDLGGGGLSEQRDAEQIAQVVAIAREVFGASLLGAYLHGSAVLGGMLPTSDVDVLAVIDRATTLAERRELVQRLMPISMPSRNYSTRPVELTVVNASDVRPWRYPPRMEFQYGEWLRDEYERDDLGAEPGPNPDLGALLAVVMLGNHPLVGPPPPTCSIPFLKPICAAPSSTASRSGRARTKSRPIHATCFLRSLERGRPWPAARLVARTLPLDGQPNDYRRTRPR